MKYYRLDKQIVQDCKTEIPQEQWEIKQVLPYEKVYNDIFVDELQDNFNNIEILEDKVIETETRYFLNPTLEELKEQKIQEIKMKFDAQHYLGFVCSNGIKVDCRESDKINWLSNYLSFDNPYVRDFDNNTHLVTEEEYKTMYSELKNHYGSLWIQKGEYNNQVNNAETKEELNSLTFWGE